MLHRLHQFRRWAGVDRAVFFSNAAQLLRLFTGPITMALVLKFLTPEIQGYFYAFAGVVAMQVFLEMGFSQNILQFASHEFAKLHFTPAQTIAGDPVAKSRLISLGRLAFGYYAVAATIFLVAVGIGGQVFFTLAEHHHAAAGHPAVHWRGAWWLIAVAAAGSLLINPAWALLNGCNQIAVTAKFNFWAALASFAVNALALIAGAGIYASALGAAGSLLISVGYLAMRWQPFFRQFLQRPQHGEVSWAREIWPFQWRIAVSWMSGYFVFDLINPIAFYFCGPVAAGQLGMSFQLIRMISNVALTWIYTKAPKFGMLIAARAWTEMDALWRRSTLQVFIFYSLGLITFLTALPFIGHVLPKVPARLAPFAVTAWLGGGNLIQNVIGCFCMELRAHKQEPTMWLSVANAILSVALILPLVHYWGITGEAMGYAFGIWAVFLPACRIYYVKRLEYRRAADHFQTPPSPTLDPGLAAGGFS
jgi:O-antigen/teichoic acid export membrane protein